MDRGYPPRYEGHGYQLYSFGHPSYNNSSNNNYRPPPHHEDARHHDPRDERRSDWDDTRRRNDREVKKEEYRRDDREFDRRYERDGKRNDTYDKEERRDRPTKRPKDDIYTQVTQKDTMELNIELQLTIKVLKKDLSDKKEELDHLQRLLDDSRDEISKLKREVSSLKDEVDSRKQQIKSERSHRDSLFKENQFVIDRLEGEIMQLRALYPILPPSMVPPIIPPINLPHLPVSPMLPNSSSFSRAPSNNNNNNNNFDFPLQKKQLIAANSDRCLWVSLTSLSSQELFEALGGSGIVENVFVTPRLSAFITFYSSEKAQEGAALARALFCHQHNGVRCNIVNNSLWVGNVTASEGELRAAAEGSGEVESIKLMPSTHCAFISFKDTSAAITACSNMDGMALEGGRIVVNFKYKLTEEGTNFFTYPVGRVLYVGDLDSNVLYEELYGLFETFGKVEDVWTPTSRDYAFITFDSMETAVVAKFHLHGRRLGNNCLKINFRKGADEPTTPFSETLSIQTNPPLNTEEQLRSFIAKYAKNNYNIEHKRPNKWIVTMGSGEEGIIVKAHLNSRTVSGVHFEVSYMLTKLKKERMD